MSISISDPPLFYFVVRPISIYDPPLFYFVSSDNFSYIKVNVQFLDWSGFSLLLETYHTTHTVRILRKNEIWSLKS